MAISDKITSIQNHLKDDWDSVESLIGDTELDKNIENISSALDDLYNDLPKVTGSGTSITLDDTRKGRLESTLSGNTSQFTTTGKNLLPNNGTTLTRNGMTFTANVDGSYTLNGTTTAATDYNICQSGELQLAAGTYTLSSTTNIPSGMWLSVYEGSSDKWAMTGTNTKEMVLSAASNNARAHFYINSGVSLYNLRIYPMIVSGTTVGNYEPYTGKAASPSPDYPQEVHIVRGDNKINITGRNLLQGIEYGEINSNSGVESDSTTVIRGINYIPYDTSSTYYVSVNNTLASQGINCRFYNASKEFIGWSTLTGSGRNLYVNIGTQVTATDLTPKYFRFRQTLSAGPITSLNDNVMITKVNDMNYEPYSGTSYPINLGMKNLWSNQLSGFLPQSGSYPTTNSSYPNARYVLVNLIKGQSITLSGVSFSGSGRVRYIDIDTNEVVGNMTYLDSAYYTATHTFGDGFYEGTITAKKDFIVGIMDLNNDVSGLIVNYGTTPQTISPNPIELGIISTYKDKFIRTSGKNLFDKDVERKNAYPHASSSDVGNVVVYDSSNATYSYVKCAYVKSGETYTISWKQGATPASVNTRIGVIVDENNVVLQIQNTWQNATNTLTFTSNYNGYLILATDKNATEIMVNKGDTAIDYEPYGSGDWYLHKEIGKVVLNGSENWGKSGASTSSIFVGSTNITNAIDGNGLSNLFTYSSQVGVGYFTIYNNGANLRLCVDNNTISTIEAFKTWLSSHNVVVYYVLATPTSEELTYEPLITQLNLLEKAMSKDGQTNISQVNNDLPFIISASALKEWSV